MVHHVHRVLFAEDHTDTREMIAEFLRDAGSEVLGASDGADALRLLSTLPHPCVIVIDWLMPGLSGLEFRVAQLQNPSLARIPTVQVSASAHRIDPRSADFDRVIAKPLAISDLLRAVSDLCPDHGR